MNLKKARKKIATVEVEQTNLSPIAMAGFYQGYEIAASGKQDMDNGEITQGAFDLMSELLHDLDNYEFHIGRVVGFLKYHDLLLEALCSK